MAKYIDAERLRAEIKRQIRLEELNFAALGGGGQTFCINTLEWVLKRIDSLQQEQQEVELEKEVEQVVEKYNSLANGIKVMKPSGVEKIARHFYELGFNARKEE